MKKYILFAAVLFSPFLCGQESLEEYIQYGLENNLVLKQKTLDCQKSLEALREARALFYPGISFIARYTRSEGGRTIEFPAGTLMNPVFMTLNALTHSNLFSPIDDQVIKFLRPREHETKIRVTQPVFSPEIYFNTQIRKEINLYNEVDLNQYRRELIAEIKKAYYNVAMASAMLDILKETGKLLEENVRVSRKLFENDKVTKDFVYRSESELARYEQELQRAENNRKTAVAYFNFLLNRPLETPVITSFPDSFPAISPVTEQYTYSAISGREELEKLRKYQNMAELQVKMNQANKLPDIYFVFDYGFQGEEYRFNKEQDYLQASAVLTWTLFEGYRNRAKIRQAMLDKAEADSKLEEAKKKIELEVLTTLSELFTSEKEILTAEKRLRNASEGFRLVQRKYEEGQASLLEFLDARSNLTQAEENLVISKFNYLSCFADFERVTVINSDIYEKFSIK
ncbi:MAG TPA: TolC family protein [Bacteroidales bacterium]|nr:TolC family protein [Bacteroidales bacterium]HPP92501.1 TolC family protein [Bacteroidales bacterium]